MNDLLEFLNKNSGGLSAIFSAVVTLTTVIYAWLTARLFFETRQMRQVQTEPRLQVTYKTREEWINFIDISVKNIGLGSAHNVQFTLEALSSNSSVDEMIEALKRLGALKNGLLYLGPSHMYASFWTSLADGSGNKIDSIIKVNCRYESSIGTKYQHDFILDLSELKGSSAIGEPPLLKISKHLETIEKDIHSTISGYNRMSVNVFSQKDRESENEALKERFRKERNAKSTRRLVKRRPTRAVNRP